MPKTVAIRRDIYVADSDKDARHVRQIVEDNGYRGFDPDALVIGDVSSVADTFNSIGELGYTDIIVRNLHSVGEKAVASTERLISVREKLGLTTN
ncbi:MAG TPA: hypothetical protein DCM54_14625 [Gammaproteobacteria bacterium]|nr:hypothetical protein [Gammaproteobacteria bacterium]